MHETTAHDNIVPYGTIQGTARQYNTINYKENTTQSNAIQEITRQDDTI